MTRMAPGIMVSALRSGAGKTLVTLGLQRAARRCGHSVVGIKCGPDYIDPGFHRIATGQVGTNLDSWMMGDLLMETLVRDASAHSDLVIGEGAMGLFDGVEAPAGRTGAAADVARHMGWPVVLVIDISGQGMTAGAAALGCAHFDPGLTIAGVILNNAASDRHARLAAAGVAAAGLELFGILPRDEQFRLPERHLGLVQAEETAGIDERIERLADVIQSRLDVGRILAHAATRIAPAPPRAQGRHGLPPPGQRIAVAADCAFSFFYQHLASSWRRDGAELMPFSPLADEAPDPAADAVWLAGGYPELHAGRLAACQTFLQGIREFSRTRPVHGECGGYMVLGERLTDASGNTHQMAGLLPLATSFLRRQLSLGYRVATLLADGVLGPAGSRIAGHIFHYSTVEYADERVPAFARLADSTGAPSLPAGQRLGHVTGSFFHAVAPAPNSRHR